jgi:O-antigen/teichoic acid export membrane protein
MTEPTEKIVAVLPAPAEQIPDLAGIRAAAESSVSTSAKPFFMNVAETFISKVFLILVGVATTVVISRALGPEGRGYFAVAVSLGAVGIQFANLGLHASNTFAVSRAPQNLSPLLANSLAVSGLVGGLTAALSGLVFWLSPSLAPLPPTVLWLALLWIPFGLAYLLAQGLLLGLQRVRAYNLAEIAQRCVTLALLVGIAFFYTPTVELMFGAGFLVLAVTVLWMIRYLRKVRPR